MTSTEIWKDVIGYKDIYQVSSIGRVRSLDRTSKKGKSAYRCKGKVLKPAPCSQGYPMVSLCVDGKAKSVKIHYIVAHAFIGPRPNGLQINHKDGVKDNNNVKNLEYVTPGENVRHAFKIGLNSSCKLTDNLVRKIRNYHKNITSTQIIKELNLNIHIDTINKARRRNTWVHVK